MRTIDPATARDFARHVVHQLRDAGYEALWAGGCVRDELMGRTPKDYDVATSAKPEQIRTVFGFQRTLAIGASFGVITVLGPRAAGQIDVATFRRDATYSDGRHPDSVTFCDAAEDARRRDFTINGLFYDPLASQVIDYVEGQVDLAQHVIRAIGDAGARLAEDKLRMLRAVRFAATLGFTIEPATWDAICQRAAQIQIVSSERITEELRRMLVHPSRRRGVELLRDSGLLREILPEATSAFISDDAAAAATNGPWDRTVRILEQFHQPSFAVSLAGLLREVWLACLADGNWYETFCRRWRLSNHEADLVRFCCQHEGVVRTASKTPWPRLQRVLIDARIESLLSYAESVAVVLDGNSQEIEYCRARLQLPAEELNPPPLITGDDLRAAGIPPGPIYKELLEQARDAQLLKQVRGPDEARDWIRQRWQVAPKSPHSPS